MKFIERRWVVRGYESGVTFAEIVIVVALVGIMVLIGIPHLQAALRSAELQAVEQQLKGLMWRCRE